MAKKTPSDRPRKGRNSDGAQKERRLKEKLKVYIRNHGARYLDDPNITSVGIGYAQEGNQAGPHNICLQFTVEKKVEVSQLEALGSEEIPDAIYLDGDEVSTAVIERFFQPSYELIPVEAKSARKQRLDPMVPGISVSHPKGSAGTLGAIVYDLRNGYPCILSNWHVLHTPKGRLGDGVVQPGPHDDNRIQKNRAGRLLRSHLGAAGDCAIAQIEGRGFDARAFGLDGTPRRVARPDLGDTVVKSGRTTGLTYGRVTRIETLTRINYRGDVGIRKIGGFEIGPHPDYPAAESEISMPGDSGAAWVIADDNGKATDIVVGLHFAGEGSRSSDERAVACYMHAVFQKLEIGFDPPVEMQMAAELERRTGYETGFLGERVEPPKLRSVRQDDIVTLGGSSLVRYTHFSVCLSKSRRLAHFVAWNIDGGRIRRLSRRGIRFRHDPRIDERFQVGNDIYVDNKLDRGHLARRADLVWGTPAEARRANRDSFYFTNIAPQHTSFNQSSKGGLWGTLENAIFEDANVKDLKVSVFAGSIFKESDMQYRGIRVPRSYWKVIAYVDGSDDALKAQAFILSQDDLLNDIESLDLDPFRLWQVPLADLEERVGLEFGGLVEADGFALERDLERVSLRHNGSWIREINDRSSLLRPQVGASS